MQLEGKQVLITGGGSGIGRALAIEAVRRGMRVGLCGRRLEALQDTAALLGSDAQPLIIAADITDKRDRATIVETIHEAWGRLDLLVNNAGVVEGGPLAAMSDEALDRVFRTNAVAPLALTRDLLPALLAGRPSRIVNVGSIFGDIAYPGFAAYSASKFALRGWSSGLRRELRGKGIGITYAAPRATNTDAAAAFATLMSTTKMRLDQPDRVAAQIWHAVATESDSVYARGPERLFVLIQRLFPRLIDRSLAVQESVTPITDSPHPIY